ncbi:MAG: hypothetical protein H0U57_03190 [Tatlockia sp.]|nr:hypothetical protein [Tatlockia sp.]
MTYSKKEGLFKKQSWVRKKQENQIVRYTKDKDHAKNESQQDNDLIYLQSIYVPLHSGDTETLSGFADYLEKGSPLSLYGINILFSLLGQCIVEKNFAKNPLLDKDLYKAISRIASFAINQFNHQFENEPLILKKDSFKAIASFIYNLGIIGTAYLDTPAPSNKVLNTIGLLLTDFQNCPPNSEVISDYLLGMGLLSRQRVLSISINQPVVSMLLNALTYIESNKISSKDIAKSFYGLYLMTKAQCMYNYSVNHRTLSKLLLIQGKDFANLSHAKKDERPILTSIHSLKMLVKSRHLDYRLSNKLITEGLENIKVQETILKPKANVKSVASRYGLECLFGPGLEPESRFTDSGQLKEGHISLSFSL